LMRRPGHTLLAGEAAKIRAMVVRKTKTDRRDARHLLDLLRHDRFPTVWIPDPGTRDLRALVAHRVRLVRMRTMVKNGLQAIALSHRLAGASVGAPPSRPCSFRVTPHAVATTISSCFSGSPARSMNSIPRSLTPRQPIRVLHCSSRTPGSAR